MCIQEVISFGLGPPPSLPLRPSSHLVPLGGSAELFPASQRRVLGKIAPPAARVECAAEPGGTEVSCAGCEPRGRAAPALPAPVGLFRAGIASLDVMWDAAGTLPGLPRGHVAPFLCEEAR